MLDPLFTGANHICIVTGDLDRAVRVWADRYGVGPWRVFRFGPSEVSAFESGEPTRLRIRAGLADVGGQFRVELIQPLDGDSTYAESLRGHTGADHIHHVRLEVPDYAVAQARLSTVGLTVALEAQFRGRVDNDAPLEASYFATADDLGFTVEIAHVPPGFAMAQPEYVYPAEDAVD